jgi:hypothetical protein
VPTRTVCPFTAAGALFAAALSCLPAQDLGASATLRDGRLVTAADDWQWNRLVAEDALWKSRVEAVGVEVAGTVRHGWTGEDVAARCDTRLLLDCATLCGLPGTTVHAETAWRGVCPESGGNGLSNLGADGGDELGQAWIETQLPGELSVRAGRVDFRREVGRLPERSGFTQAATALQPGDGARTAAAMAPGLGVEWTPTRSWQFGLALFEREMHTNDDDVVAAVAARTSWGGGGRIEFGGYGAQESGAGAYAAVDQRVLRGGGVLLRASVAESLSGEETVRSACGLTWRGLFGDANRLGVLLSRAEERTGFEAFAEVWLAGRVRLRPDVHYVTFGREDREDEVTASFGVELDL